ncbi:hypothetical protein FZC66_15150 [Priestia megaterium]|nr:hypothetical protein FZC66_15150 [Priestia megaterium]
MNIAFILIGMVGIVSLLGTIWIAKDVDENYRKSTKRRFINLSAIYAVLLVGAVIAVSIYIGNIL